MMSHQATRHAKKSRPIQGLYRWVFIGLCGLSMFAFAGEDLVVRNGLNPSGDRITLELIEDLRFGADRDEEVYIWPGLEATVAVDHKGQMYIVEPLYKRMMAFDQNGEFLRVVGGPGEGPGEFTLLNSLHFLDDGAVAFGGTGAQNIFNYYDRDMQFVKRRTGGQLSEQAIGIVISPDGRHMAGSTVGFDTENGHMVFRFGLINDKGVVAKPIGMVRSMIFDGSRINDRKFWVTFMADQLALKARGEGGAFAFDHKNRLYAALGKSYTITRQTPDSRTDLIIERDYKPISRSQEMIDHVAGTLRDELLAQLPASLHHMASLDVLGDAVAEAEYPLVVPPIQGLRTMEDGTLIVIRHVNPIDGHGIADLFDEQGKFLGSFTHPRHGLERMVFRDGYAYTLELNEFDENECVRYKVIRKSVK